MKAALTLVMMIAGFATTAHASFESQSVSCASASGQTKIDIQETNRPDFELTGFDSQSKANSDEYGDITTTIAVGGKEIKNARVQVLSASEGKGLQSIIETGDDGKKCNVGYTIAGIEMKANVTLNGKVRLLKLTCSQNGAPPSAAIDCE